MFDVILLEFQFSVLDHRSALQGLCSLVSLFQESPQPDEPYDASALELLLDGITAGELIPDSPCLV